MSELEAWLCAILYLRDDCLASSSGLAENLDAAKSLAFGSNITSVRWNRLSNFDRRRPSIFVYGDALANGIFLKGQTKKKEL